MIESATIPNINIIMKKHFEMWTDKQIKILEELYPITPTHLLVEKLNKTYGAINKKASLLQIKKL